MSGNNIAQIAESSDASPEPVMSLIINRLNYSVLPLV